LQGANAQGGIAGFQYLTRLLSIMKLHLPKTLLAAALAASCIAGSHALAVVTGTYTATYSGSGGTNYLHDYTFTNDATGATAGWNPVACSESEAILHFTSNSYKGAPVVAQVKYNTFSAGGLIVDSDSNVSGIKANGTRNFLFGHANKTSASQINRDFELSPSNGLALAGTQTWTVANGVTFSLKDSDNKNDSPLTLNGSLTLNGQGNVDFTGQTLSGNGTVAVDAGTLKNATISSGNVTVNGGTLNTVTMKSGNVTVNGGTLNTVTIESGATLALGENVTLSGVAMSGGSVLDLTGLTLSADTPLVTSTKMTISDGVTISLSGLTDGTTLAISDTTLNNIIFLNNGQEVSADRSEIIQENGTFTFVTLGRTYDDMVWNGNASSTWNTTDANWTSVASGSATPIAFANDDSVTFNSVAAVTVAEGVKVGGMSVTGVGTVLELSVANDGYVHGDVVVSGGATLVLMTKTSEVGSIRGNITVNADSTLQFNDADVTGYGGDADATTRSIRIEERAELVLNHTKNETFRGQLVLNGKLKGGKAAGSARWDFFGGSSTLEVESGKTASVENVKLRLRQNDTRITVNQNATLTVQDIDKGTEGNGVFKKLGSGAMTVAGVATLSGFSLDGGTLEFSGGGALGNINLTAGATTLKIGGAANTTYTMGTLTAVTDGHGNHFDRNMTIAEGVTVNGTKITTNWGMGVITVNGVLNLSEELRLTSGTNTNLTTQNVINGSGTIVTNEFITDNQGTYKLEVANFTASKSTIGKETTIAGGNVSLGALALNSRLLVNKGNVTIKSVSGNGTLTATAGSITLESGSHAFGTLDISSRDSSTAKVVVKTGGSLSASTLWGCSGSSIELEEGATYTSGSVVISGVASSNGTPSKIQAGSNAEYSIGSEAYTISDATVTVNSASGTSIGNILVGGSLINAGAGEVTTTSGWNNLRKLEARGGNINIQWFDVQESLDTLVIAEGKTVAAHTKNDPLVSTANEATLVVTKEATFGAGATLNANLDLRSGVTLTLDGALQMGSILTLNSGMTLAGDKLAELTTLTFGSTVELFTGVDTLVLGDQSYTMGTRTLGEADAVDLHNYFSNVQANNFYLGYNTSGVVYAGRLVPEPATATLGLLALAGLCARRRRK